MSEMEEKNDELEFQEYVTFNVTTKDGKEVEMAVVDEFELDGNSYVAASLVEDDTINEDEVYLYRVADREEFLVEKIEEEEEYGKIAEAYMSMQES